MAPRLFDEVLVETTPGRIRAAAVTDGELIDWLDEERQVPFAAGSIVLGRVTGTAPDLGAVFVDIGYRRPAILDVRGRPPDAGSAVMVQIVESPSGDKGGRVTRRLALAGQHAVLLPGGKGVSASRRLDSKRAPKLVGAFSKSVPQGSGVLLRWTAGCVDEAVVAAEIALLARRWQSISQSSAASAPATLHDDGDGLARIMRMFGAHGAPPFVFNDRATLRAAQAVAAAWFPGLSDRLSLGEPQILDRHDIASTLALAEGIEVRLPSGGSIAIETTRVCTTADVDSGSASGDAQAKRKTNLEAAREIARQLWLRDIGGMMIVDFIRMENHADRRRVLDALGAAVATDRIPVHVAGWTRSSLFELVRQRGRGGAAID